MQLTSIGCPAERSWAESHERGPSGLQKISGLFDTTPIVLVCQSVDDLLNLFWVQGLVVLAHILQMVASAVVCLAHRHRVVCQKDVAVIAIVFPHAWPSRSWASSLRVRVRVRDVMQEEAEQRGAKVQL